MNANYSVELTHAFVIGADELKKIARLLFDRIGNLAIRADCSDDVSRSFNSVNELIAYENPKAKEIRRIHLTARSDDFSKSATIALTRWRGISIDFNAGDVVVSRLRTEILDIVAGLRPWYSAIHRVDFVSIGFLALFLIWFGLLVVVAFKWIPIAESKENDPSKSAFAQLVIYGGVVVLFGVGIVLNQFRDSIFPSAVFLIGQGVARFKGLERFQWGFIIAFVVSFAAGIVLLIGNQLWYN